jgi:lysophospholipase L1-like esterase
MKALPLHCRCCLLIAFAIVSSADSGKAQDAAETPVDFPGDIRLLLPEKIYAVAGIETNIYFDNTVLVVNPANYVFDVTCRRGIQQNERWTFTPMPEDVGMHPLTLEVRSQKNEVIARATTAVEVVTANAGKDREISLLTIGDSLTNATTYTQQIYQRCQATEIGNPKLTLIGSRDSGIEGVRHEGYGGWTAERFATKYSGVARGGPYRDNGSPFLYKHGDPDGLMLQGQGDADASSPVDLDFGRYCKAFNNDEAPDFVTILLGCNDTFHSTDADIEERIDNMFGHYENLLKMIHQLSPDTQIGAQLLVPPAATQDAFGANYKSGQTRWQYKRNQHRVVERMIETFGGREVKNIFLIPSQLNLDCANNYPTAADGRQNNGVHPAATGYRQIGDTIYAWIKSRLATAQ